MLKICVVVYEKKFLLLEKAYSHDEHCRLPDSQFSLSTFAPLVIIAAVGVNPETLLK